MILIFLLIIIGIMAYFIRESQKFNHSAELIQLQDSNKSVIQDNIQSKSPLLIHNLINDDVLSTMTFQSIVNDNPGYIIKDNDKNISLSIFNDEKIKQTYVIENQNMIKDLELYNSLNNICNTFSNDLTCNLKVKLNLFKGDHKVTIQKNKHNSLLITQLFGETIFYIINPKHSDIVTKDHDEIKKWAIKIILKKGLNLYIPPEWYYIYEVNGESIFANSFSDNYFTFLYNYLR